MQLAFLVDLRERDVEMDGKLRKLKGQRNIERGEEREERRERGRRGKREERERREREQRRKRRREGERRGKRERGGEEREERGEGRERGWQVGHKVLQQMEGATCVYLCPYANKTPGTPALKGCSETTTIELPTAQMAVYMTKTHKEPKCVL